MAEPIIQTPPATISNETKMSSPRQGDKASFFNSSVAEELQKAMETKSIAPATPSKPADPVKPAEKPADLEPKKETTSVPPMPTESKSVDKPVSKPVDTKIPDPEEFNPKTHKAEQWNQIKRDRDSWKQKYEEAVKTTGKVDDVAFTKLKEERDEYEKILQQIAIERDPKFEAKFRPMIETAQQLAESAVPEEYVEKVKSILQMRPGKQRDAAIDEISDQLPISRNVRLNQAIVDYDRISKVKEQEINNARQNWQKTVAERNVEAQQTVHQLVSTLDETIEKTSFPVFKEREGDAEWNRGVNERKALAKHILTGTSSHQELANAALWAAAAPAFLEQLNSQMTKIEELEAEVAKYKSSNPGVNGGGSGIPSTDDVPQGNLGGMSGFAQLIRQKGLLQG